MNASGPTGTRMPGTPTTGTRTPVAVTADGRFAVRGASDCSLQLWDLTEARVAHAMRGHNAPVTTIALTPDDRLAVSAAEDGMLYVWELAGGRARHAFQVADGQSFPVALTPGGDFAIAGTGGGDLVVYDVRAGRATRTVPAHRGARVNAVAVSPDGRTLASAADDGTTRLWDAPAFGAVRPPTLTRAAALARIELVRGDLRERAENALVYATGLDPANAGWLGAAVHSRVSAALRERLVGAGELAYGAARVIALGPDDGLRARCLIQTNTEAADDVPHTVESIARAVAAALDVAESVAAVRSIALPSVGSGAAHFTPATLATEILATVAAHLSAGSYLERVVFAFVGEETHTAYAEALGALRAAAERGEGPVRYALSIRAAAPSVTVGEVVRVRLDLRRAAPDEAGFAAPPGVAQLYGFIRGDAGLRVEGSEAVELPFAAVDGASASAGFDLRATLVGDRRYTVDLYLEDPDATRPSIERHDGTVAVAAPAAEEPAPVLPPLELRVGTRPDVLLRVATSGGVDADGPHHLTYRLSVRLPDLRVDAELAGEVELSADARARLRVVVLDAVAAADGVEPADARAAMAAVGTYLFDQLVPAASAARLRERMTALARRAGGAPARPMTWLIVGDEASWLPWELVVPYADDVPGGWGHLAQAFHLSRWVEGLGPPLQDEVPVGEIALAHYESVGRGDEEAHPGLREWRRLLNAPLAEGITQVAKPETAVYALHVLRYARRGAARAIAPRQPLLPNAAPPPNVAPGPDGAPVPHDEVRRARLDLRLKRPVVTLAVLDRRGPDAIYADDRDWLLPERALPFLRAGASALVGPWWPTSDAADRVFWTMFYDLLTARQLALGESVWRARLAVARALPDRADWLAYTLFGDPRARAYWPEESEGYTTLECLDADAPLRVGKTYHFRTAVRSRPPVWHQDRLVRVHDGGLPESLSALFLAPGLQADAPEPVAMAPVGRTMVEARCALTAPQAGTYLLTVRVLRGDERLHLLRLPLTVAAAAAAAAEDA